jgi:hypothetical protein
MSSTLRILFWLSLPAISLIPATSRNSCAQTPGLTQEEKLERDFTDPLATLPQLSIRDAYSPATYGTNVETNQVIVRPIIPRVPPYTLLPFAQLVRPTFTLVTIPSPRGGSRTEFGDLSLFDLAVLRLPLEKWGVLVAVGPSFVFPTATSRSAGQGAWQAGPAIGGVYTGIPGLLMGFVLENPISFAYTSPDLTPQNTLIFQPVLALHLWHKWYLRSAEATWSMGWRHNSPTTLPLSVGLGRTFDRPGGLPPLSFFVTPQWMLYRQFAPITPQTTVNFGVTMAFPWYRFWR